MYNKFENKFALELARLKKYGLLDRFYHYFYFSSENSNIDSHITEKPQ